MKELPAVSDGLREKTAVGIKTFINSDQDKKESGEKPVAPRARQLVELVLKVLQGIDNLGQEDLKTRVVFMGVGHIENQREMRRIALKRTRFLIGEETEIECLDFYRYF